MRGAAFAGYPIECLTAVKGWNRRFVHNRKGNLIIGLLKTVFEEDSNLVPRVLRLLGQRFGRQERLWGNGIFSIFLIGYSGNNGIGESEVGSMLTLPSIMSRTSQETSVIFQRGQQVTLLVRDWRISIHLLVSAFG